MSVLGCDVPLMQAPLGRGAAAPLAIAVSRAGGLGTLGASWTEPAALREQIRSIAISLLGGGEVVTTELRTDASG